MSVEGNSSVQSSVRYVAPKLQVLGDVVKLTAAGTANGTESNDTKRK